MSYIDEVKIIENSPSVCYKRKVLASSETEPNKTLLMFIDANYDYKRGFYSNGGISLTQYENDKVVSSMQSKTFDKTFFKFFVDANKNVDIAFEPGDRSFGGFTDIELNINHQQNLRKIYEDY